MTIDNSTHLEMSGGNITGSAVGGSGHRVQIDALHLINQIDHTPQPDQEVNALLKQLVVSVELIHAKLPETIANQVKRDLEALVQEINSPQPRPQWWRLSLDGLKKAAADIGEIGKPVVELAVRIADLLSKGLV